MFHLSLPEASPLYRTLSSQEATHLQGLTVFAAAWRVAGFEPDIAASWQMRHDRTSSPFRTVMKNLNVLKRLVWM
jgi:hypothetical protein